MSFLINVIVPSAKIVFSLGTASKRMHKRYKHLKSKQSEEEITRRDKIKFIGASVIDVLTVYYTTKNPIQSIHDYRFPDESEEVIEVAAKVSCAITGIC